MVDKSSVEKSYNNKKDFIGNYGLRRSIDDLESVPESSYQMFGSHYNF